MLKYAYWRIDHFDYKSSSTAEVKNRELLGRGAISIAAYEQPGECHCMWVFSCLSTESCPDQSALISPWSIGSRGLLLSSGPIVFPCFPLCIVQKCI